MMKMILATALALAMTGCYNDDSYGVASSRGDFRVDVIDGDTFRSAGQTWRLARIDAPEFEGHCREGRKCAAGDPMVAKIVLESLTFHEPVKCKVIETDVYGRNIAECFINGRNISDRLLQLGVVEEYKR